MAQSEHLPIYKRGYELCLHLEQVARGFSRSNRALGGELGSRRALLLSLDHDAPVTCISWTPDGRRIVLGEATGGITVLDAETAERIVTFEGHAAYVKDLAWSPDGRTLASASGDGDVRLWRSSSATQPDPRDLP